MNTISDQVKSLEADVMNVTLLGHTFRISAKDMFIAWLEKQAARGEVKIPRSHEADDSEEFSQYTFAGVVMDGPRVLQVYLAAVSTTRMNFHDASKWAAGHGAALPTLRELRLVRTNCEDYIPTEMIWSSDQIEANKAITLDGSTGRELETSEEAACFVVAVRVKAV